MKRLLSSMIIVFAIISFVAAGTAIAETINLTAASGGMGGTWFGQMATLSKLVQEEEPGIVMKTVPGSGLANVVRIHNNEAQVAWSMPIIINWAYEGKGEFKKAYKNMRGIAVGFTQHPVQLFVTRKTGINSVAEIAEKKIPIKLGVSPKGRVDETVARMLLEYYGMSYDKIKKWGGRVMHLERMDQVKKIKDRQANALIHMMPNPIGIIQEMVLTTPMKSLPQDPNLYKEWGEKYGFASLKITPDMYKQKVIDEEFITPAVDLALIVSKEVDQEVVYRITKAICENEAKVQNINTRFRFFRADKAWNAKKIGCPLHPGAEKYYREKGYIK